MVAHDPTLTAAQIQAKTGFKIDTIWKTMARLKQQQPGKKRYKTTILLMS